MNSVKKLVLFFILTIMVQTEPLNAMVDKWNRFVAWAGLSSKLLYNQPQAIKTYSKLIQKDYITKTDSTPVKKEPIELKDYKKSISSPDLIVSFKNLFSRKKEKYTNAFETVQQKESTITPAIFKEKSENNYIPSRPEDKKIAHKALYEGPIAPKIVAHAIFKKITELDASKNNDYFASITFENGSIECNIKIDRRIDIITETLSENGKIISTYSFPIGRSGYWVAGKLKIDGAILRDGLVRTHGDFKQQNAGKYLLDIKIELAKLYPYAEVQVKVHTLVPSYYSKNFGFFHSTSEQFLKEGQIDKYSLYFFNGKEHPDSPIYRAINRNDIEKLKTELSKKREPAPQLTSYFKYALYRCKITAAKFLFTSATKEDLAWFEKDKNLLLAYVSFFWSNIPLKERLELISFLLEHGADPFFKKYVNGRTIYEATLKNGQTSIIKLFDEVIKTRKTKTIKE